MTMYLLVVKAELYLQVIEQLTWHMLECCHRVSHGMLLHYSANAGADYNWMLSTYSGEGYTFLAVELMFCY